MKCSDCNTINEDNARFCRNCGQTLSIYNTVMDKYPEYKFKPTSVYKLKRRPGWMILSIFLSLIWLLVLINGFTCIVLYLKGDDFVGVVVGTILLIVCGLLIFVVRKCFDLGKNDISSIADYVSTERAGEYLIIVKDGKFGLLSNRTRKVQIPCIYNYLKWDIPDKILIARKASSKIKIDIYNNTLS